MIINNKVTIFTTLVKNTSRENQIERFIKYHSRFNIKIIIIKPNDVYIRIDKLLDMSNIKIIECSNQLNLAEKILLALNNITTPYIAWITDDDFTTIDFLEKSIKLMDKNNYIIACDGLTIFKEEKTAKRVNLLYSFESYKKGSIKNINVPRKDVFRFQAENFNPAVVHGVIKKDIFQKAVEFNINIPVNWGDRTFLAILMLYGNIHFVNAISNIRSHGTRLLTSNPTVHIKADLSPNKLIMNDELINKILNIYITEYKKISPTIKGEILYYLIKTTYIIDNTNENKLNKFLKKNYLKFLSFLEVKKMQLFNKQTREDLNFADLMLKKHPL